MNVENKKVELKNSTKNSIYLQDKELEKILADAKKLEIEKLPYFYIGGSVP